MNTSLIKNHLKNIIDNWFNKHCEELSTNAVFCHQRYNTKQYDFPEDSIETDIDSNYELQLQEKYLEVEYKEKLKKSIIVSGGCITSLFLNEDVNDYDIYFTDKTVISVIIKYYLNIFNKHNDTDWHWSEKYNCIYKLKHDIFTEEEFIEHFYDYVEITDAISAHNVSDVPNKYIPICITPNAISLTNGIQLITRFTGTPEEILSNFDFIHTNNYYLYHENKLITNHKAIESILTKQLIYNGSKYPICSMIRTRKFIKRGWNISAGEYLKMAFQLQELDLYNIQTLREQLIGVDAKYFIKFLEELKTLKELTNKNIFNLLNNIFEEVGDE